MHFHKVWDATRTYRGAVQEEAARENGYMESTSVGPQWIYPSIFKHVYLFITIVVSH